MERSYATEAVRAEFNIRIGAQILAWNIRKYGMPKAVAVYNRWAERLSPVAGPFENQSYVAAVLGNYKYRESPFSMLFLSNGPAWFLVSLGGNSCSDSSVLGAGHWEAALDSKSPYAGMRT